MHFYSKKTTLAPTAMRRPLKAWRKMVVHTCSEKPRPGGL